MKKMRVKQQLKQEFCAQVPSDFDRLFAACQQAAPAAQIPSPERKTAGEQTQKQGRRTTTRPGWGAGLRYPGIVAAALALVLVLSGVTTIFMSQQNAVVPSAPVGGQGGYFLIDINPSVELRYDESGHIREAKGLNKDGEALLTDLSLIGQTYAEASGQIFDACVRLGYFSADRKNNAVLVSAVSESGERDDQMTAAFQSELSGRFVESRMYGTVITGVHNEQLDGEAEQFGINGQKLALIRQYELLGGELDESQYASLTIRELYDLISERQAEQDQAVIDELTASIRETREDLMEDVQEHLEDLIEKLSSAIEDLLEDDRYEERLQHYENEIDYLESTLETVEDQEDETAFLAAVDTLLTDMTRMEKEETHAALKDTLGAGILSITALRDSFRKVMDDLARQEATALEMYEDRKTRYENSAATGDADEDQIRRWQEEQASALASDWYRIKSQWDTERDADLDDD